MCCWFPGWTQDMTVRTHNHKGQKMCVYVCVASLGYCEKFKQSLCCLTGVVPQLSTTVVMVTQSPVCMCVCARAVSSSPVTDYYELCGCTNPVNAVFCLRSPTNQLWVHRRFEFLLPDGAPSSPVRPCWPTLGRYAASRMRSTISWPSGWTADT